MVKLNFHGFGARTELVGSQTLAELLDLASGTVPCAKAKLSEFDGLQ
jgi:hypothetical protein